MVSCEGQVDPLESGLEYAIVAEIGRGCSMEEGIEHKAIIIANISKLLCASEVCLLSLSDSFMSRELAYYKQDNSHPLGNYMYCQRQNI